VLLKKKVGDPDAGQFDTTNCTLIPKVYSELFPSDITLQLDSLRTRNDDYQYFQETHKFEFGGNRRVWNFYYDVICGSKRTTGLFREHRNLSFLFSYEIAIL